MRSLCTVVFLSLVLLGCGGGSGGADEGELGGICYGNGTCDIGLTCVENACLEAIGDEGNACYGNGTCNGELTCVADVCVVDPDRPDASLTGADANAGEETLTFTFTSSPVGIDPVYAPANIVATWIEDAAGTHIATIDRQAAVRVNSLKAWRAASGPNNLDAVTGATRLNHATPVVVTWAIPANVTNGTYAIRVETCDTNAVTPADNNQGTFTFNKNGISSTNPGLDGNGYKDVTIDYVAP